MPAIVALAGRQLLRTFTTYPSYAAALHDAALATVTGELVATEGQVVEVVLAVYSVVVFATLAA